MSICDDWIRKVECNLPEECTTDHLIKFRIFSSPHAASAARKVGKSPPYFKFGARVIYPKTGVINWLKEKKHEFPVAVAAEEKEEKKLCQHARVVNDCRT